MSTAVRNASLAIQIEPAELCATRLPPFGHDVLSSIAAGGTPNVYLFATLDAWNRARRRREHHGKGSALILPPGEAPDSFRWPVVPGGLLVVAIGQPRLLAFELGRCVTTYGTPLANVIYGDNESLIVRRPEWRSAA